MRFPLYPLKIGAAICLPALAALFLGLFAVSRLDGLAAAPAPWNWPACPGPIWPWPWNAGC
ncbi:MAG: hypothetical protein AB9872_11040 [Solidesulfovibrio sp.]